MTKKIFLIGVAGGSGSGKTTFAKKVLANIQDTNLGILHMDMYYLSEQPQEHYTDKGKPNFDHPKAFDWDLLQNHLLAIKNGEPIDTPIYDFKISRRSSETSKICDCSVIIFEGIFSLFKKEIRDLLDIKCFLHVDSDIRFTRRLHRDVNERGRSLESVISQYYETVRPMYDKFLNPQKQYADFIVAEETDIAAEILSARIREFLKMNKVSQVNGL